eukprot:3375935-Rhodomonas_salina.3
MPSYAISGTDLGCAAISLRACYAMSSTDIGDASSRPEEGGGGCKLSSAYRGMRLRTRCVKSGTDVACDATRSELGEEVQV